MCEGCKVMVNHNEHEYGCPLSNYFDGDPPECRCSDNEDVDYGEHANGHSPISYTGNA